MTLRKRISIATSIGEAMAANSVDLSKVDWSGYPPGYYGRALFAMQRSRRLRHCLFCAKRTNMPFVFLPHASRLIGGEDIDPKPYKLCAGHRHVSVQEVAVKLGFTVGTEGMPI